MHEILPTKIARSSAEIRRGIAAGEKENAMRGVVAVARGARASDRQGNAMMKRVLTLAVAMASLPAMTLAQNVRPQAPAYCFDLSRVTDLAVTKERFASTAGQLPGCKGRVGGLERLLALRRRNLYLRLCGDGDCRRSRESAGGNSRSSQIVPRGGMGRGCRPIFSQLRRFAQCLPPGLDHVEHGSNRQQETCRSSHRLCPQELGAGNDRSERHPP
jgi:hypothetical protein